MSRTVNATETLVMWERTGEEQVAWMREELARRELEQAHAEGLPIVRGETTVWLEILEADGVWDEWGLGEDNAILWHYQWLSMALELARIRFLPVVSGRRYGVRWIQMGARRYLVAVVLRRVAPMWMRRMRDQVGRASCKQSSIASWLIRIGALWDVTSVRGIGTGRGIHNNMDRAGIAATTLGMDPVGTPSARETVDLWPLKLGASKVACLRNRDGTIIGSWTNVQEADRGRNQEMRWLTTMRRVA